MQSSYAIDDVRPVITDSRLATAVQQAVDQLHRNLEKGVRKLRNNSMDAGSQAESEDKPANKTLNREEVLDSLVSHLGSVRDRIAVYWHIDKNSTQESCTAARRHLGSILFTTGTATRKNFIYKTMCRTLCRMAAVVH